MLEFILTGIIGYLLGCLNGAIIVSKALMKNDIRGHGSGNAGLTNFLRTFGGLQTLLVVFIDIGKCVAGALIGGWLLGRLGLYNEGKIIGGAFVLLGHMFPVFFGFKGGKGILSGGTLAFMMDIRVFAIVIGLFIILVALTRLVSLGSLVAAAAFPLSCVWAYYGNAVIISVSTFVAILIIYMHRANIKRLINGTEPKLSFGKKDGG